MRNELKLGGLALVAAAGVAVVALTTSSAASVPAFPEAQGFGSQTAGGRGGQVIRVSNLNDSGAGSLRACLIASGPRICVFTVAGYIDLQSPISITNGNLTVAGQTAPGDGITVRSANGTAEAKIEVKANDVVLRYFRIRPGTPIQDHHIIGINPAQRVVLDHMSVSWNGDEQMIVYGGGSDVTIQWSINSEALNAEGGATASKGMVQGPNTAVSKVSVHHSLFAHNNQRNPNTRGAAGTLMDWRYNTVYNYGFTGLHLKDAAQANLVGNTVKAGPNHDGSPYITADTGADASDVFASGNQMIGVTLGSASASEFTAPDVTGGTAASEHVRVLAEAGASARLNCTGQFVFRRDAVDTRVVSEVQSGTDSIPATWLNDETQVGGYPPLAAGTACADSDADGMPNEFEAATGLTDSSGDGDGDGYTNIEEYLNGTSGSSPPPTTTTEPSACEAGDLPLSVASQTSTTITFSWTPPAGTYGYRFLRSDTTSSSTSWNGSLSTVKFSKGAECYTVVALDDFHRGSRAP